MSAFENHLKRKIYVLAAVSDSEELRNVKIKLDKVTEALYNVLNETDFLCCSEYYNITNKRDGTIYKCEVCGYSGCNNGACDSEIPMMCRDCATTVHGTCLDGGGDECPNCGGYLE